MKIAITGKGGVGKTTLAAILAKLFVDKGYRVLSIDADPDSNLAAALGFPQSSKIVPLIEMKRLIEERTGAKRGDPSPYFKLNPRVDDIPERYFTEHDGIRLAIMGTVRGGNLGCTCPENAFLKALLRHLIVEREEVVILDMEAGIEHLGRGTAEAMDRLIIVVEPGSRSIETAYRIKDLAKEIGLKRIEVVGNKMRGDRDRRFVLKNLAGFDLLGFLSYNEKVVEADLENSPFFLSCPEILEEGRKIIMKLDEDEREK